MDKIENIISVWDNGATSPIYPDFKDVNEYYDKFFLRTGAIQRIATRWTYLGETYEDPNCPIPIPDGSGLVYATKGWKTWVVLEPNGRSKFEIKVPRLSQDSKPDEGELGEPRHRPDLSPHIMYGEGGDGDRYDVRFYFDMRNGDLVRAELVGRHW